MMERILIIEDELSIAELQKDYLEIHGFYVDIATDGAQGLEIALNGPYDLIIIDLMLPHINGFEICKRVRASSNIPILMVTARSDDIDIMRGLGIGADDYITKPFRPNELVARVKAHLAHHSHRRGLDPAIRPRMVGGTCDHGAGCPDAESRDEERQGNL